MTRQPMTASTPSLRGRACRAWGRARAGGRGISLAALCLAAVLILMLAASAGAGAADPLPGGATAAGGDTLLLRFPALSRDSVAFVYAGDLWSVPRAGGAARRLTTDAGLEWFPRFSPDGGWIAFTGEYDGNRDVYVMPAEGGEPRRLTFWADGGSPQERAGPNNEVIGWTPDGRRVLFRSRHQAWEERSGRLYTVGLEGGLPEALPMPEGGLAAYSPDGRRIVYNRIFRNFRTWKRYRGGMTQNLWIYDLAAGAMEKLTENDHTATDPMWVGDSIFFTSDEERTANIFSIDLRTRAPKKWTRHDLFDVRWASAGPGGIVYENGGVIHLLDTASGEIRRLPIRVPSDQRVARAEFVKVGDKITEVDLSPGGKRAVFVARGEVFTVPAEKGNTRNLTRTPGAHERGAAWSPDGKWIAFLSDRSGEDEVWIVPHDGGEARQLTNDGHAWRFPPAWSPDSARIAFADKDQKLFVIDVGTRQVRQADQAAYGEIDHYAWSPDSRWLAYAKPDVQRFNQIYLYSLDSGKVTRVTSQMTESSDPCFDAEGRYLFFLSDRELNASLGGFDLSYVYSRTTKLFALTLRRDLPSPFAPRSDEPGQGGEKKEGEAGAEKEAAKGAAKDAKKGNEAQKSAPQPLRIDVDGIEERVAVFPMAAGNFSNLSASKTAVFYLSHPDFTLTGGPEGPARELRIFDLDKRKDDPLLSGIDGYALSPDGGKILYKAGDKYGIIDAKPGTVKVGDGALKTDCMQMRLDHRAEWNQIFHEAWRLERDFFYVPNMHGVDWPAIGERYAALLPYVGHRSDLTYLIGEMIGELNTGHTYVGGGDAPKARSVPIALLGADYALDAASGRYRIARILEGQNWAESRRSPLTEPGIDVRQGAYVLKIDGLELAAPAVPDDLLQGKTGGTVTLTVGERPSLQGARDVVVRPLSDEASLRYYDRIETNRRKVDAATGGKVAYVHIPDMSGEGLNEFVRQYYPQIRKQGLIIDARNNGGGFVSELILERLRRVLTGLGNARNSQYIETYPAQVFLGPMVCLINHYSASDGDIFPYYFRKYGLGPLIGTRTWGGVVGIRGYSPLVDGGYVTRPEFGSYGPEGRWVIEGHGVDPDIEVDNRDDLVAQGRDPQLERAIDYVLEEIRKKPPVLPLVPPPPIKK